MDENRNEAMQQPIEAVPVAPAGNPVAKTALILSIIAAALCELPVASIAAIVLAALALPRANKAMACANAGGGKKPMAIVAKVLSIVALVLAIVFTVIYAISFIAGIIGRLVAAEYPAYFNSFSYML